MGSSAWFSVAILALFVISIQTEEKRLRWIFPEGKYRYGVPDSSSQYVRPRSMPLIPNQEPALFKAQQAQAPRKEFEWTYPQTPVEPTQPQQSMPNERVPANSVSVRCWEANVEVEVNQDFFGTGKLIEPGDIRLGDCFMTGDDISSRVLVFNVQLHQCGSSVQMTEDELIYTFTLVYTPQALGETPIVRTNGATVDIQCRYARQHNVSSDSINPIWFPYSASEGAEDALVFTLRLMTADLQSGLAFNTYLGELLHIEASVIQYNHVPMRVFVQSCVATAVPDVNASPRYSFIENNGCLVDAKLTGSRSRFLPRAQNNKLQFELEAFRFEEGNGNDIYITCQLVATAASTVSSYKACSFTGNRWTSSDGMDEMCSCCDATCGLEESPYEQWESSAFVGPIKIDNAY